MSFSRQTVIVTSIVLHFLTYHATSFTQCRFSLSFTRSSKIFSNSVDVDMILDNGSLLQQPYLVVALTREQGKNNKLRDAIIASKRIENLRRTSGFSVQVCEVPCIEHADGPDKEWLVTALNSAQYDYIAITSPEAAKVFASAWIEAGHPKLGLVAAVGKATEEALSQKGISVGFVPSKATAETLALELPLSNQATIEGRSSSLLYPASSKAHDTLQNSLENRGFSVLRLNTYDTVTATWSEDQLRQAKSVSVACFASPSAIKAWLVNTASLDSPRAIAACIGETSASECRKREWDERSIFYPEKPGVDGWVLAIANALESISAS